jgi:hypothetical protein
MYILYLLALSYFTQYVLSNSIVSHWVILVVWAMNFLYFLGGISATCMIIGEYYVKLKNLKKLISTQYRGPAMIIYQSLCLIMRVMYMNFLNYMNSIVEKKDNKTSIIRFSCGNKLYALYISTPMGPEDIVQIIDNDNNDITDTIAPYIRLRKHLQEITPKKFGYKNIEIITATNDDPLFFDENEEIRL